MSYFVPLSIILALCFGLQSLALHAVGGRTIKSESNYFSSVARIQNALLDQPEVVLLGSSRIGRLPNMPSRSAGVVNMGCDGGSAVITLRAMDRGVLPVPPEIVIEGNTLLHELEKRGHEISGALESLWFRAGNQMPVVSATARPSAIAYTALLGHKIAKSAAVDGPEFPVTATADRVSLAIPLPSDADALAKELTGILGRLKARGARILLVMLPPAAPPGHLSATIPFELARVTEVPILDLTHDLPPNAVHYTDGIHMAPDSAAGALRSILKAIGNEK